MKGGIVVCAGIHMSDIPAFPYQLLWGERVVRSVANLTRADGEEFLRSGGTHSSLTTRRGVRAGTAPTTRSLPCARVASTAPRCSTVARQSGGARRDARLEHEVAQRTGVVERMVSAQVQRCVASSIAS